MTFTELLIACSSGVMPQVRKTTPLKFSHSDIGVVTTIRKGGDNGYGVAVRFEGMEWDTWYHAEQGTDNRSRYMSELELILPANG